jgi:hypothetical protein
LEIHWGEGNEVCPESDAALALNRQGGIWPCDQPDLVIKSAGTAGSVWTTFILLTPFSFA